MKKDWLITDTHFDHDNIGVYCDRPDGWMKKIIDNWKRLVQPEDIVIHLGDVQVGRRQNLCEIIKDLPGHKVLVLGNHDKKSPSWYASNGFEIAVTAMVYKGVTLTHKPSEVLFTGTDINIHGHVHNNIWTPSQPFQRLLAIEHVNYMPVDFIKWVNMARSRGKWERYTESWPIPKVSGKRKNANKEE